MNPMITIMKKMELNLKDVDDKTSGDFLRKSGINYKILVNL